MKIKRKGAYEYNLAWHQNHSALVIQKAAEAHMLRGEPIEEYIRNHQDILDFMLRTKVPRSAYLLLDDRKIQNITRYFISVEGGTLIKVMKPLPGKTAERRIGINVGWKVTECNKLPAVGQIDYRYYIQEARKLVI